jgi:hypothetical protein
MSILLPSDQVLNSMVGPWGTVVSQSPAINPKKAKTFTHAIGDWLTAGTWMPPVSLVNMYQLIAQLGDPATFPSYDEVAMDLAERVALEIEPTQWLVTPTDYTEVATGIKTNSTTPINDAWIKAAPGDLIRLAPGSYDHFTLKKGSRTAGSEWVKIVGDLGGGSTILLNPVGGSDSLFLEGRLNDLRLDLVRIQGDDRSALKTSNSSPPLSATGGARNVVIRGCELAGLFDPTTKVIDNSKWGMHHYETADWSLIESTIRGITQEHCTYWHNPVGDHLFRNCTFMHAGRTAIQMIARTGEGPVGSGNVLIDRCYVEDVCLESGGGGSAFTFRGGMPTSSVTIQDTVVRLGCNAALDPSYGANITGALVVDEEPNSGGSGITVYPGGTGEVHLNNFDSEVGLYYVGSGSAPRPNIRVLVAGLLEINSLRAIQHPGANQTALEIGSNVGTTKIHSSGTYNVVGKVRYHGVLYTDWATFLTNHPEVLV